MANVKLGCGRAQYTPRCECGCGAFKKIHVIELIEKYNKLLDLIKDLLKYVSRALEPKKEFAGYRLKKPIALNIEYDASNNLWCVENKDLELYGCGKTLEEALEDAEVNFEVLITEYLLESNEILSEKALELKNKLAEYVVVNPDGG